MDSIGESSKAGNEADTKAKSNSESGNPNVSTMSTAALEELRDKEELELMDSIPAVKE